MNKVPSGYKTCEMCKGYGSIPDDYSKGMTESECEHCEGLGYLPIDSEEL